MYDKGPVPGRNDACWCGSGKKYKKCHSAFDERLERLWEEGDRKSTRLNSSH